MVCSRRNLHELQASKYLFPLVERNTRLWKDRSMLFHYRRPGSRTVNFNDPRKQTLESALRSLLWQVATYPESSPRDLQQLYGSCGGGTAQPSIISLIQSFGKALLLNNTVIVIDALDECTTRSALLSWLTQVVSESTGNVQFIVTSRKEQEIEAELGKWLEKDANVPLQQLGVEADIVAYIDDRLRNDPQLQRWRATPEIQDEIEAKLKSGSHGM
jgi:hypothetical protein